MASPALSFAGAHCPHPAGYTCYEVDTYFDGKLIGWTCSCEIQPLSSTNTQGEEVFLALPHLPIQQNGWRS